MNEAQLKERLAERAAAEGLLDVAYTTADSPFGPLLLADDPARRRPDRPAQPGRARSCWTSSPPGSRRGCSRRRPGSTTLAASSTSTSRDACTTSTCRSTGSSARTSAAGCCAPSPASPTAETRTYTQMATSAGNERAVRAAGTACGSNPIPIVVPCHRVLRTGGGLGGYGGGLPMKEALLELEGSLDEVNVQATLDVWRFG